MLNFCLSLFYHPPPTKPQKPKTPKTLIKQILMFEKMNLKNNTLPILEDFSPIKSSCTSSLELNITTVILQWEFVLPPLHRTSMYFPWLCQVDSDMSWRLFILVQCAMSRCAGWVTLSPVMVNYLCISCFSSWSHGSWVSIYCARKVFMEHACPRQ